MLFVTLCQESTFGYCIWYPWAMILFDPFQQVEF
jgi:hypothetical protein